MESDKDFPLVQVSGTSFEVGQQHGRQAAPLIQGYLDFIQADPILCAQKAQHALTYVNAI